MSENVFTIVQGGHQAGTAYAPGAAVPATFLLPIEDAVAFELERGTAIPKQQRGRNVRNSRGAGYHGIRRANTTLPAQATFEELLDYLDAHHSGSVVPVALGGGLFRWDYLFEAVTPTIRPLTLEGGNTDATQTQQRIVSALINQLTLGFPALSAGEAAPWTVSAEMLGIDVEDNALTASGAGEDEIQTITISNADGGTWIARFQGQATAPLAWNITGANLQTALRGLSTINGANCSVAGDGPYAVTFIGSLAKTNVGMIVADATGLTNSGAPPDPSIAVVETNAGVPATYVAARTGREVIQGQYARLYEGTTATAFDALVELAGSLVSYTQTTNRNLVLRAYGSASDKASRFGFSDMSNGTFEMNVGISATAKTDFRDIWNVASPAPLGERRWSIRNAGGATSEKLLRIDGRVGILAVPFDDREGERLFRVTGEFIDDDALSAMQKISIICASAAI